MSNAATDRLDALEELLEEDGETLTFRSDSLTAIVDRNLEASPTRKGQVEFTERPLTRIELLRSDVTSAPEAGEVFEDAAGEFHRVETVRSTDLTYRCDCLLSSPE